MILTDPPGDEPVHPASKGRRVPRKKHPRVRYNRAAQRALASLPPLSPEALARLRKEV